MSTNHLAWAEPQSRLKNIESHHYLRRLTSDAHPISSAMLNARGPRGPPVDPANPNNETSYLASQATWSATNLPAILSRLDPPPRWSTAPRPPQLVENGKKVFRDRKPILDYDIPRYIASPQKLETWRLEAWFRIHRGLSYDDIWVRQPNWVPKPTNTQKNALNQRRLREVRKPLNARSWIPYSRCPGVSKVSQIVFA